MGGKLSNLNGIKNQHPIRANQPKALTNTLHIAATLNGNTRVLPRSCGTKDGDTVSSIDGDNDITFVI